LKDEYEAFLKEPDNSLLKDEDETFLKEQDEAFLKEIDKSLLKESDNHNLNVQEESLLKKRGKIVFQERKYGFEDAALIPKKDYERVEKKG
jgi:hypothetical protein